MSDTMDSRSDRELLHTLKYLVITTVTIHKANHRVTSLTFRPRRFSRRRKQLWQLGITYDASSGYKKHLYGSADGQLFQQVMCGWGKWKPQLIDMSSLPADIVSRINRELEQRLT